MARYIYGMREVTYTVFNSNGTVRGDQYEIEYEVKDTSDSEYFQRWSDEDAALDTGRTRGAQRDAMVTEAETARGI